MAAGSVVIDFLARTGSFETDTKRAEQSLRRFARGAQETQAQAGGLTGALSKAANAASFLGGPLGNVSAELNATAVAAKSGNLAFLGLGTAITAVAVTFAAAIRETERWERIGARTEAILRATGNAAGLTADDIRDLANAIEAATLAEAEDVEEAAQKLLTFKSVAGDVFRDALRLSQDLAATGFGSLSSNAVQLGKALEDPVRGLNALRRVGVSFSESQKEQIKNFVETNRIADAQRVVLAALEGQVGGAGGAEAKGLAGAFHRLSAAAGGFLETIGDSGPLSAMTAAVNFLADALERLNSAFNPSKQDQFNELIAERIRLLDDLAAARDPGNLLGEFVAPEIEKEVAAIERKIRALQGEREAEDRKKKAAADASEEAARTREAEAKAGDAKAVAESRAKRAAAESEAAQKAAIRARESAIKALEREQEILGLTPEQIRIYDLALLGLSERELAFAESVIKATKAAEDQKKLLEEGANLKLSLQTDEEKFDTETKKNVTLFESGAIDQTTFDRANKDAQESLQESLDQQEQARQAARDQLYEGLLSEEEQIAQSYERRKEAILEATEITEQERQDLLASLSEKRIKDEQTLESDRASALLSANAQLFDGLAGLAKSFAGEQSAAYRILFGISKAFAIADATLKLGQAIANAAASGPPPLNFANMAAVAAAVSAVIAQIASVAFSGARAEGGGVEKGRKYLVGERGPEMFVPEQDGFIVPNSAIKDLGKSAIRGVGVEDLFERSIGFSGKRQDGGSVTASRSYLVGERGRELYVGRSNSGSSNDPGIYSFPFAGSRATGGTALAQQRYLIGERGPEMFVPSTAGAILPNSIFNESPAPVINLRNINAFDASVVDDYLTSGAGEQVLLNVINRNSEATAQFARSGE